MKIRPFREDDREAIISLWSACGLVSSENDPDTDINLKMDVQPELFCVGEIEGQIVATVMAGYEGHRGWINYLATSPNMRGIGLGKDMMRYVEEKLTQLGCPKINLQIRGTNPEVQGFYESLGYVAEDRISMGKRVDA